MIATTDENKSIKSADNEYAIAIFSLSRGVIKRKSTSDFCIKKERLKVLLKKFKEKKTTAKAPSSYAIDEDLGV